MMIAVYSILDMQVDDMVLKQFIRPGISLHITLDEVGRIEYEFQVVTAHFFCQVEAPPGSVAVDALFIFMQQRDACPFRRLLEPLPPFHDFSPVCFRLFSLGDIKTEHAYVPRLQNFCNLEGMPEQFHVRSEIICDQYLAYRRTDCGYPESPFVKL